LKYVFLPVLNASLHASLFGVVKGERIYVCFFEGRIYVCLFGFVSKIWLSFRGAKGNNINI